MIDYKKDLIIKSAKERFARFGFKKTSMTEIAADLKMGKATLYYYYTSKEEIFKDVIRSEFRNFKDELDKLAGESNSSLSEKLKQYFFLREKTFSEGSNLKVLQSEAVASPYMIDKTSVYYELINDEKDFLRKIFNKPLPGINGEKGSADFINLISGIGRSYFLLKDIDKQYDEAGRSFPDEIELLTELIINYINKK